MENWRWGYMSEKVRGYMSEGEVICQTVRLYVREGITSWCIIYLVIVKSLSNCEITYFDKFICECCISIWYRQLNFTVSRITDCNIKKILKTIWMDIFAEDKFDIKDLSL